MHRFSRIEGIGQPTSRRFIFKDKIRLGVKVASENDSKIDPQETPYFIIPPEVEAVTGENPVSLRVMFPAEDEHLVMPFAYKDFGEGPFLECTGNLKKASRRNPQTGGWEERNCPCERKEMTCHRRAHLSVILPDISPVSIYQIDTGSISNIENTLSFFNQLKIQVGHMSRIPVTLHRKPTLLRHPDNSLGTHYLFDWEFAATEEQILAYRSHTQHILRENASITIPEPLATNPAMDSGGELLTEQEWHTTQAEFPMINPPEEPSIETHNPVGPGSNIPPMKGMKPITPRQQQFIGELVATEFPEMTQEQTKQYTQDLTVQGASKLIDGLLQGNFAFFEEHVAGIKT